MDTVEIQKIFVDVPWLGVVFALLLVWSIVWKGVGLWTAARNGHKVWFVVFLFVHTVGILEIIYLTAQRRSNSALASRR